MRTGERFSFLRTFIMPGMLHDSCRGHAGIPTSPITVDILRRRLSYLERILQYDQDSSHRSYSYYYSS